MVESKVTCIEVHSTGTIMSVPFDATILTKEQREAQKKQHQKKILRKSDDKGPFVILNLDYLQEKLQDVTYYELGYAMLLLPHISFFEKKEKFTRIGTKANPFTIEKICEVWKVKSDTARKLIKKLEDNSILVSTVDPLDIRKKQIHFSRRLVKKGDKPQYYKTYTKVYQERLNEFINVLFNKQDAAKAVGLFVTLLIKLNGPTQLLVMDESKISVPLKDENIADFFARLKVGNKNVMTVNKIKEMLTISDNRSIKKSLSLLKEEGLINQITLNKKRVLIVNPTLASRQDSSKFELCGFTLKKYFLDAKISTVLLYKSVAAENKMDEERLQTLDEKW